MKKYLLFITICVAFTGLSAFGLDLYSAPNLISCGEIYLLADNPSTSYYQPAKMSAGIALSHSNPYGFGELNILNLSAQFKGVSLGSLFLGNEYISDKVFYLGYAYRFYNLSVGTNVRYYSQTIDEYETLDAFTANIGAIWQNKLITHGITYSNISHSSKENIDLPSVFKYECLVSPFEKTNFAVSFEKEKDFELRYAFAVTQKITNAFLLSTGFISNPSQFSAGLTVKISKIEVSYGMRTHNELGYTQAVGVTYK
jgi:hypothetical protein